MPHIPLISCIVPYYNRVEFLPQLLNTFVKQSFKDFELIIVDDGSSDGSEDFINEFIANNTLNITYVKQPNSGPYVARNKGLSLAKGKLIAFQDSDDEWPVDHLEKMMKYFNQCPNVHWIFGGIKRIDHKTGNTIIPNTFIKNNKPHPILNLTTIKEGEVSIIKDAELLSTCIQYGLPCGTQSSVFRREIFDTLTYDETYRTGYDRFFTLRVINEGFSVGYVNEIHQIYHIHNNHISLVAESSPAKIIKNTENLIRGYSELLPLIKNNLETTAIKSKLSDLYAWHLSLNLQKVHNYKYATQAMAQAIKLRPLNLLFFKSYLVCQFKRVAFNLFSSN